MVDGVACKVLTMEKEKITCMTGKAAAVSHTGKQPGSPGLRQKVYDPTNSNTNPYEAMFTDGKHPVVETKVLTAWEDSYGNYTRAGTHSKGWFKAPEAGKYRFYIACDDWCKMKMGTTKFAKETAADKYTTATTAGRYSAVGYRQYHHPIPEGSSHKWVSDWITLEKGEYYQVESTHLEYSHSDHATVSVEFEKTGDFKHHHKSKAVQVLEIDPASDFETFNVTVKGAMGGKFQFMFVNPKYDASNKHSKRTYTSRSVKDNDSANNIRWALRDFYAHVWGTDVTVKKLSVNDKFETVDKDATQTVYTVKIVRAISGDGFTSATVIKAKGTTSTITIGDRITKSSPPLEGNFVIACKNSDDTEFVSRDMGIWQDTNLMSLQLSWDIPHLMLKTHIYATSKYRYRENGMEFVIVFQDLHENPKQCEIRSSPTKLLKGGKKITYNNTMPRQYGQNIMFEPVPLEMLFHDADKPQVMVKVKGLEGICSGFNCDYVYTAAKSEITA